MKNKSIVFLVIIIVILAAIPMVFFYSDITTEEGIKEAEDSLVLGDSADSFTKTFIFSEPEIEENDNLTIINVEETDFQSMGDGRPVIPFNLTTIEFPFGTDIIDVEYEYSTPEVISVSKKLSYSSCSTLTEDDPNIYESSERYPADFVVYHVGGGLSGDEHKTILNIRTYPVTYIPSEDEIHFVDQIQVNVFYKEPETPILKDKKECDLLIIAPNKFSRSLQKLVTHKEKQNIKTKLITTEEIYKDFDGRDNAEKIKYCIKESIEDLGIRSVLLVGGIDGQSSKWALPVRYSHVIIREGTQEKIEPQFLSDLYFADIYDSKGNFSSWDTNENDVFGEYDAGVIDEMDLYPDVALGRLPCRNRQQVRILVNKIINYETNGKGDWFNNMVLVSGDHWDDKNHISEGVLIMEKAKEIMSDFDSVEIYATEECDMTVRDINKALNQGAGFAYFCGHGDSKSWGIHCPPNADGWAPKLVKWLPDTLMINSFYRDIYMRFLRNRYKLPITLVGGCNNGKFDVSIGASLKKGKIKFTTSCWAWKLTSVRTGGSIATIANTGLGTHAMDDSDNNGVNDYLEAYDGWLELKFFELYSQNGIRVLGELHQDAITNYLNVFLGNNDEMDTKMVQQWQLFGDPSLQVN